MSIEETKLSKIYTPLKMEVQKLQSVSYNSETTTRHLIIRTELYISYIYIHCCSLRNCQGRKG